MKKYYWIWYECQQNIDYGYSPISRSVIEEQKLIDVHPLQWINDVNEEFGEFYDEVGKGQHHDHYQLRNWKEITEEEYNLYKGNF